MYAQSKRADIAKEVLGFKDDLLVSEALVPEADPQDIWQEIRTVHRGSGCILLASHEPLMGRCTAFLLGAPDLLVDFKKGAIVRIDFESFGFQPAGHTQVDVGSEACGCIVAASWSASSFVVIRPSS